MNKLILSVLLIGLISISAFAQKQIQTKDVSIVNKDATATKLSFKYQLTDAQISQVTQTITAHLGEKIGSKLIWSSAKDENENYTVKINRNVLFIRAMDKSSAQKTAEKIYALVDALNIE